MKKDNMGNGTEEINHNYKRLEQLYAAIKKTRKMYAYWFHNKNAFMAWAVKKGFGRGKTIIANDGFYSMQTSRITDLPCKRRITEKSKLHIKRGSARHSYSITTSAIILAQHGFPKRLMCKKLGLPNIYQIDSIQKKDNYIEDNRMVVDFQETKKTMGIKRIEILRLITALKIQVKQIRDMIRNSNEEEINIIYKDLFGKTKQADENVLKAEFSTRYKGMIGEMAICKRAVEKGMCVSKPLVDNLEYDLIIDVNGILKKVQVKYSSVINNRGNVLTFDVGRSGLKESGDRKYKKENVDIFLLYSSITDKIYCFNIETISHTRVVHLTLSSKSVGGKNTFFAKDFEW